MRDDELSDVQTNISLEIDIGLEYRSCANDLVPCHCQHQQDNVRLKQVIYGIAGDIQDDEGYCKRRGKDRQ